MTQQNAPAPTSWLSNEPSLDDLPIQRTIDVDVLVCGAGTAGLSAFAYACEKGAHALLIEKRAHPTPIRNELGAIDSRIQREENVAIDVEELLKQMSMYSSGFADQRLHRIWAQESGATVDWYASIVESYGGYMAFQGGYDMELEPATYTRIPTGHRAYWPDDAKSGECMIDYAVSRGGEALMSTALVRLIKEGSRVVGAIALDEETGAYLRINAACGVIVATGGYAANHEMMDDLQPESAAVSAFTCGANMGDGIKACLWAGASMDKVHTAMIFDRCAINPDETPRTVKGPGRPIELVAQPFLKVDLNGRRFMNESSPYDFITHRALSLPGHCYCVIFDADFPADTEAFECAACCRIHPFHNGTPAEHPIEVMEEALERMVEQGRFVKADTLEDLAEGLGIPADAFVETVTRYNELADSGVDEDFGKEPHRLRDVRRPPFYGARACGFTLCTLDGIRIDASMRALRADDSPIEGLYVAGCDSGSYFAITYPNLVTGACAGRSMTFALRAVREALGIGVDA